MQTWDLCSTYCITNSQTQATLLCNTKTHPFKRPKFYIFNNLRSGIPHIWRSNVETFSVFKFATATCGNNTRVHGYFKTRIIKNRHKFIYLSFLLICYHCHSHSLPLYLWICQVSFHIHGWCWYSCHEQMFYHWPLLEKDAVVEPFDAGWTTLPSMLHLLVPELLTESAVFSLLLNHFFPFYLHNATQYTKRLVLKHQITYSYSAVLLCTNNSSVLSSKV